MANYLTKNDLQNVIAALNAHSALLTAVSAQLDALIRALESHMLPEYTGEAHHSDGPSIGKPTERR